MLVRLAKSEIWWNHKVITSEKSFYGLGLDPKAQDLNKPRWSSLTSSILYWWWEWSSNKTAESNKQVLFSAYTVMSDNSNKYKMDYFSWLC